MASPSTLRVSAVTALAGGIVLPVLETIRRWYQLSDIRNLVIWLDDYLIGAVLIWAGLKVMRRGEAMRAFLAGAWGFATGMALGSVIFQAQNMNHLDPAAVNGIIVLSIKIVMLLACISMFVLTAHVSRKAVE